MRKIVPVWLVIVSIRRRCLQIPRLRFPRAQLRAQAATQPKYHEFSGVKAKCAGYPRRQYADAQVHQIAHHIMISPKPVLIIQHAGGHIEYLYQPPGDVSRVLTVWIEADRPRIPQGGPTSAKNAGRF